MDNEFVENRIKNRLLHLSLENRREDLDEKDLFPRLMYLNFRLRKLVKNIPVLGSLIRRIYLFIRYGIRSDSHA